MFLSPPRVQMPDNVRKGEVFMVKTLAAHPMETGLRRDDEDKPIPRKLVHTFSCRYAGAVVFSVDLHESVAENPYFEFWLTATTSGPIEFLWEEDGGAKARLQRALVVTG